MATKKTTAKKKPSQKGRPAPLVAKAGITKEGKRRYGCGGKLK